MENRVHKRSSTGALSSTDADNVRFDLVSPIAWMTYARVSAEGADEYGPYNWEKGTTVAEHLNRALRHVCLYLFGDRSDDHLGHAFWRLGAAIHSEKLWPDLNAGTLRGPCCTPPQELVKGEEFEEA